MRISCKTVSSRACGNRSLVRANGLAGSRGAALRIARQAADTRARRIIRAVREQSQIEAMREALRGDRERAEARRKAGRPGHRACPQPGTTRRQRRSSRRQGRRGSPTHRSEPPSTGPEGGRPLRRPPSSRRRLDRSRRRVGADESVCSRVGIQEDVPRRPRPAIVRSRSRSQPAPGRGLPSRARVLADAAVGMRNLLRYKQPARRVR
jgi:hypothetical protein